MRLTLIGESHFDLDLYDRLSKLFNYLKPSVIGVEHTEQDYRESCELPKLLSPERFATSFGNAQKRFPDAHKETLELSLRSSICGINAIVEYASKHKTPIIYGDSPEELAKVDKEFKALGSNPRKNKIFLDFLQLSPELARQDVAEEYAQETYPVAVDKAYEQFLSLRDEFTASLLRKQKGNVVYICGLDHIFGDYYNQVASICSTSFMSIFFSIFSSPMLEIFTLGIVSPLLSHVVSICFYRIISSFFKSCIAINCCIRNICYFGNLWNGPA